MCKPQSDVQTVMRYEREFKLFKPGGCSIHRRV